MLSPRPQRPLEQVTPIPYSSPSISFSELTLIKKFILYCAFPFALYKLHWRIFSFLRMEPLKAGAVVHPLCHPSRRCLLRRG